MLALAALLVAASASSVQAQIPVPAAQGEAGAKAPPPPLPSIDPVADVPDDAIAARLERIFSKVERFAEIRVAVDDGVVSLRGSAPSGEDARSAGRLARAVEGVVYVDNEVEPPTDVGDRLEPIRERVRSWGRDAVRMGPLLLLALVGFLLVVGFGRLLARSDRIFERLVKRPMLRDIARRGVRIAFFLIGALFVLELLDATTLVGTVLGAAGVMGLVIGFAFRDIAENYLASFLLAARRPFAIGDIVTIGEHTGKIMRLTMRETVIMTFEGNHLTIPNAQVFKAAVLNCTRNPRRRLDFAVGAGIDTDLVMAQKLGIETLRSTPGVLEDPAPFMWIEELGESNVAVRFFAWVDQRGVDFFKVRSAAIRRVKVALEQAGIDLPEPIFRVNLREVPPPQDGKERPIAGRLPEHERLDPHADDVSPDPTIDEEIAAEAGEGQNLLADDPR